MHQRVAGSDCRDVVAAQEVGVSPSLNGVFPYVLKMRNGPGVANYGLQEDMISATSVAGW